MYSLTYYVLLTYIWLLFTVQLKLNLYSNTNTRLYFIPAQCQSIDIDTQYWKLTNNYVCEQSVWLQDLSTHLVQLKVLLCRVERVWHHRDPLDGPGPSQDQQWNQDHFLHPFNLSAHSSLRGLNAWDTEPAGEDNTPLSSSKVEQDIDLSNVCCCPCMYTLPQRKKQTSKRAKFSLSVSLSLCSDLSGQLTTDKLDFRVLAISINQYLAQSDIQMSNK